MQYPSENIPNQEPRLLDQVRGKIRLKHYSIRTEQAYTDWIKRFILHFGKKHPRDMGAVEVEQFLTYLAVNGKVAASTQNQAKCALLFLYKEVLTVVLPWLDNVEQAKTLPSIKIVLALILFKLRQMRSGVITFSQAPRCRQCAIQIKSRLIADFI